MHSFLGIVFGSFMINRSNLGYSHWFACASNWVKDTTSFFLKIVMTMKCISGSKGGRTSLTPLRNTNGHGGWLQGS